MAPHDDHIVYMKMALEEAEKAVPVPGAFCVGCVLVARLLHKSVVLSTGYSRELPGNTHAEANALAKVAEISPKEWSALSESYEASSDLSKILECTDVYTTLEPCSIRTSGLSPCADALIKAKVRRCIIGVNEPPDFVKCEGADRLKAAGIEVIWLSGMEEDCLRVARKGH
ncbi:diaminohydroxyphosphoribosylamino-pyrimidine deaminase [Coprinopsis cinerea okayama7|uniref:Diaminohydroxyphosphoribosylamino-pyrimidine deaminase n=1 Tax=Coprinopsis cinerea (strain Okayama-7 / 130 / ATCC MYA-4618 / FGSC 9003) TaxID=240176 RepID=A8NF95_COPC7|nr:diaminohydroxyphosphoribosylamino-pyrimidine deaminase [Coprinopsis cinerea okayama7\|eukprot:XP_001833230.2 diaminohydroxyphosphoribosylamino-pyrimidine deaminase [Coprinopsis cinerea okayama7\